MVNVYLHFAVLGLPDDAVLDDDLVETIWRELPGAGVGGCHGGLGVTVSQFALSTDRGARRQLARVERAIGALGYPAARVRLDEAVRYGWADDLDVLVGAVRWCLGWR